MKVTRSGGEVAIVFEPAEVDLLRLALKRATFEDTDPARQRAIFDFALALLKALGDEPA